MLNKSFKPAKCKTALKLAASRIKLLKNKREAQIKQLKRELAQLLQSGQDQTARIRVEHVVREEKTMVAYDLIEIYCELVATRLPIIESQKNCPIDLKEAIASLVFASPRCADIPELMDIRKHLTAKYGKEFASAAVELRPDCGVSRLLVEKLSAKAPDGPTKIKILSAIADEHNVKWEPKSFEEKDIQPPADLLNGPSTFEQASNIHVKPSDVHEPTNSIDKRPPISPVPSRKHDLHSKSYDLISRQSARSEEFPSSDLDSNSAMLSGDSHRNLRPSGSGAERNENQHGNSFSSTRESWAMDFKDAESAARAAAESAERASMAARAAAELSSQGRISRHHSGKLQKVSTFSSRDQRHQDYPVNSNFPANCEIDDDKSDDEGQDDLAELAARFYNLKNNNSTSGRASSKFSGAPVNDNSTINIPQMPDRSFQNSPSKSERSEFSGKASIKRVPSQSELTFIRSEDRSNSQKVDSFEKPSIRKQPSTSSMHSHSQTVSEDHDVLSDFDLHKFGEEVENPFAIGGEKIRRSADEISSYDKVAAVFDDSDSEEGEINVDDEGEHNVHLSGSSLEKRHSFSHPLLDKSYFSPGKNMDESAEKFNSESLFASEKSSTLFVEASKSQEVPSHSDGRLPFTFDDSDGPSSESEEELSKSGLAWSGGSGVFLQKETVGSRYSTLIEDDHPHKMEPSLAERENTGSDMMTSSFELDNAEVGFTSIQKMEVREDTGHVVLGKHLDFLSNSKDLSHDLHVSGFSSIKDSRQRNEINELLDVDNENSVRESSLRGGTELKFGTAQGGLQNKGYQHPPYRRKPSNTSSVSNEVTLENRSRRDQSSSFELDGNSKSHDQGFYGQTGHAKAKIMASVKSTATSSDFGDDQSDDESPRQTLSTSQATYNIRARVKPSEKSSPITYFDSDNSDSDENRSDLNVTRTTRLGTGLSQWTKASSSTSSKNSHTKSKFLSESKNIPEYPQQARSRRSSFTAKIESKSQSRISDNIASSEHRSEDQAASSTIQPSKKSSHSESSSKFSHILDVPQDRSSLSKMSDKKQVRSDKEAASKPILESKRTSGEESLKSSGRELSSNPTKSAASGSPGNSANSSSQNEIPSREKSSNRASHVHPKLPDYDTLTAQLLALRQNRQ